MRQINFRMDFFVCFDLIISTILAYYFSLKIRLFTQPLNKIFQKKKIKCSTGCSTKIVLISRIFFDFATYLSQALG